MTRHWVSGRWRWLCAAAFAVTMASACGSGLTHEQLAAANGTAEVQARQVQSSDGSGGDGTGGAVTDAVGGSIDGGSSGGPGSSSGGGGGSSTGSGGGASSGTGAAASTARGPQIILGSIGVASGPIGDTVAPAPDGARAWVASINARGGLNGHPVKLIIANDDADSSKAASLVRQMVESQGVVALFGTYAPTTLQAVTPYLEQKGIPIVGGVSGNSVEESSPMVFNPQPGPSISPIGTVASIGAQMPAGQRNLAVIYCFESAQCKVNRDGVVSRAAEFGVKVVYEAQVSLAQPDFSSQMSQARAAGAHVVVGFFDLNSLLRLTTAAHRQGWHPTFAGSFQNDTDAIKNYAAQLEGLIGISLTVNYDASPLFDDYRKALRQFVPGGTLGGLGAQAWAQGKLLEAIAPKLTGTVKPVDIVNALHDLKGVTLGGVIPPITFNKGPHRDVNHCYVPTRFIAGKWTQPLGEQFRCVTY